MSEYKTKLEEFTLEELKTIVDEAPSGWEDYSPAVSAYFKSKKCYIYFRDGTNSWDRMVWAQDFVYINRFDIEERIMYLETKNNNLIETTEVNHNPVIEISEFVNEVRFVDGKIYLDIDKEDIEGVIKLLEEMRDG